MSYIGLHLNVKRGTYTENIVYVLDYTSCRKKLHVTSCHRFGTGDLNRKNTVRCIVRFLDRTPILQLAILPIRPKEVQNMAI